MLGIALAGRHPLLAVDAVDRDALAVALTVENARLNRVRSLRSFGSVVLDPRVCGLYDLAVSNLPAKAGHPVLKAMVRRLAALVRPEGLVAVVVVAPLEKLVRAAIEEPGGRVLFREASREHVVLHYDLPAPRPGDEGSLPSWMLPFVRGAGRFEAGGARYEMTTVYGLADFDTVGYQDELAMEVVEASPPEGTWAFWRPGQGHLPAALLSRRKGAAASVALCGRDLLSLEVSRLNLLAGGLAAERVETLHLPFYCSMDREADFLSYAPDDDAGWRWQRRFAADVERLVRPGGLLLVSGRSGALARIGNLEPRFRTIRDRRRRGFRAMLLGR